MYDRFWFYCLHRKFWIRKIFDMAQPYDGRSVRAVTDNSVSILGQISVAIKIKGITNPITTNLLVSDQLSYDCLLGNDFHRREGIVIDCGKLAVKTNDLSAHISVKESGSIQNIVMEDDLDFGLVPLDLKAEIKHNVCCSIQLENQHLNGHRDLSQEKEKDLLDVLSSFNYNKLGQYDVFTHQIDTENHPLISLPPYRYSPLTSSAV